MIKAMSYYWRLFATGLCFVVFGLGAVFFGMIVFPIMRFVPGSAGAHRRRVRTVFRLYMRSFVGLMNAVNLIDGLDGLAAGVGLFATAVMCTFALLNERWEIALMAAGAAVQAAHHAFEHGEPAIALVERGAHQPRAPGRCPRMSILASPRAARTQRSHAWLCFWLVSSRCSFSRSAGSTGPAGARSSTFTT